MSRIIKLPLWGPVDIGTIDPAFREIFAKATSLYPFWEGRGSRRVWNVRQNGYADFETDGTADPDWMVAESGLAVYVPDQANAGRISAKPTTDPAAADDYTPSELTIVSYAKWDNGNDPRLISRSASSGSAQESDFDYMMSENADNLRFRLRTGGVTSTLLANANSFSKGDLGLWACHYDGADMRCWYHCKAQNAFGFDSSTLSKTGLIDPHPNGELDFGGTFLLANGWREPIYWCGVWPVALTEGELEKLADRPFGMFTPARRVWVTVPAAIEEEEAAVELNAEAGSYAVVGADASLAPSAASFNLFNNFVSELSQGTHDLDVHTVSIYLSNTTPDAEADAVKADLAEIGTGNGYDGPEDAQQTMARAAGVVTLTGSKVTITASGGPIAQFRYVVLFNDSTISPTDALIGWWDFGVTDLVSGESFVLLFNNGDPTGTILTVA